MLFSNQIVIKFVSSKGISFWTLQVYLQELSKSNTKYYLATLLKLQSIKGQGIRSSPNFNQNSLSLRPWLRRVFKIICT